MATIQGKASLPRGFANFAQGVLEGYVKGRGMQLEQQKEERSAELQAQEIKTQQLQQAIAQAQLDEHNANAELRRLKTESEIKILKRGEPLEIKRLAAEKAKWDAAAAKARADREELELQIQRQYIEGANWLNQLRQTMEGPAAPGVTPGVSRGTASGADTGFEDMGEGGEVLAPEGVDTDNLPAGSAVPTGQSWLPPLFQGSQPGVPAGGTPEPFQVVPGGKQVLSGPIRPGNVMEEEAAADIVRPEDVARTILPPGISTPSTPRLIPIMPGEVEAALKSKDVNDAIRKLMATEGVPFGAELGKLKTESPEKYLKAIEAMLETHERENPIPYKSYKPPRVAGMGGNQASNVRRRVIETLTSPDERAIQNPMKDIDAAVEEAVAEESVDVLMGNNSPIKSFLSLDAAQGANIARYNGRLLNAAMRDVFGPKADYLRFSDDLEYTLRQIVHALYTDEYSATGNSMLSYDQPVTPVNLAAHDVTRLLRAYWQPMMDLEQKPTTRTLPPGYPLNSSAPLPFTGGRRGY